jgi:hypothetical protein
MTNSTQMIIIFGGLFFVAILGFLFFKRRGPKSSNYKAKSLLNVSEKKIFKHLTYYLKKHYPHHFLVTQVSMGEFIAPADTVSKKETFSVIARYNQKRNDFAILNSNLDVVVILEYQGGGHYGDTRHSKNDAKWRDHTKKTILKGAKIPLIEIPEKWSEKDLHSEISHYLN